ncbi:MULTISPECIES: helix-turn-helix domain-containing protein [Bradyrhizobium]|jgi:DNA-binding CsgD family transcriptional regulator|uniref:DNA-binding CsgD family transcriptional regulator n=1 Tax=Bradyrhizobium ottawaense TaxID=931866 RepID=A0A2U8P5K5_9BRAD|nr:MULTISPECIES: helix-turn-helix transcriptional regulator [Bradyrhizobium]AWL92928.1 LuxR family transcriptional regulator [Bradyrhizobium ottawaense]MBR1293923.1 helix-turn-helix transcriptional regulator [Bradyrhizobium ottawaense]MBR1326406.1 helix-turn-helix transcriptional regulator [Bradyrhizobium ottawaense]MBR1336893.1 helix-turn-helix transcriptional regulator [Bradyrhizobium ottawaense]MBR1367505.1 helix-turn-helix transcriptional regulator [Bradyrhizobium ottawaense]
MGSQNDTATDSRPSEWYESSAAPTEELDFVRLSAARAKAADEMAAAIARELNGPLTALLLYMGEIKHHSDQLAPVTGDRAYLQRVVENALAQTERVCGLVKQLAGPHKGGLSIPSSAEDAESKAVRAQQAQRVPSAELLSLSGQKRLTKREREVLRLISEGYSNKQGALRMQISPRTFESHRAEAMRKLGARNTADLVRAALLHSID